MKSRTVTRLAASLEHVRQLTPAELRDLERIIDAEAAREAKHRRKVIAHNGGLAAISWGDLEAYLQRQHERRKR